MHKRANMTMLTLSAKINQLDEFAQSLSSRVWWEHFLNKIQEATRVECRVHRGDR